ncbi:MAG TPA: alpha-L-arabinofuranosidase C-terminal domain-containing protein [Saprospiraceae bacterium]|nr:alpha-L-arabinofuranosidase C-terminal domain-containing protein [Saprospiraceae bacterium]HMP22971.1 alpha-L-arabinofuranosidase C-terminal domain-containing protein [Saprospiraceae bacterium]
MQKKLWLFCIIMLQLPLMPFAQTLTLAADQPGAPIQSTMWGVFFEDINFGADGGLYAELVKNRSFEFYKPLMGWTSVSQGSAKGDWSIIRRGEQYTENPTFLRIMAQATNGAYGFSNEGFRGMGVREGHRYRFSVWARQKSGAALKMRVALVDTLGREIGGAQLDGFTKDWQQHEVSFTCQATQARARLQVWLEGEGTLDVDMVSLFPHDTWKNRPNGLRADLVQMIADLQPGFVRFPGGCVVEGRELDMRYQWKKTVGPIEKRTQIVNRWNTEFSYRPAPDYFQSFGVGFFEYFQLAADLGAEPLPIINCGMACQFNTKELVPMDELSPYIQDALDLIEFANGSVETTWGRLRAEMGHPEPFHLKYLGIGNEQWGEQYVERFRAFAEALGAAHPEITLVGGSGPYNRGEWFDYLWSEFGQMGVALIDEHYYAPPKWFMDNAGRYDTYDRKGPRVFAGEFAAHGPDNPEPTSRNTWLSALAEAAFMTGLERNADLVHLSSYAPLLAHVEAWQWRPDLIWFDNLEVVGTPNYYVQKIFSTNRGTHVLPLLSAGAPLTGQDSLYASAVLDEPEQEVIIKLVNTAGQRKQVEIQVQGTSFAGQVATGQVLSAEEPLLYNTLAAPQRIYPQEQHWPVQANQLSIEIAPHTLLVAKVRISGG